MESSHAHAAAAHPDEAVSARLDLRTFQLVIHQQVSVTDAFRNRATSALNVLPAGMPAMVTTRLCKGFGVPS